MYIDQLYTLYRSYGSRNSVGVIWGHWVQEVIFTKKCHFSFRLHGMVIGFMHIHQLDTLYKSYGSRNSPGVIWGHKGQKVIFTKNAISPTDYMLWSCDLCILISYIPSTEVMGLEIQSESFGVTGFKRSFSPRNAISPSDYMVWSLDSCIFIS